MRRIWGNSSVTTDIIGVGMNMQRITLMQISRTLAAAGILFVTSVAALAQPPAGAPGRGGGRGGPPAPKSPEVSADSRVTFRLRAPNAKEVAVTGMAHGDRRSLAGHADLSWERPAHGRVSRPRDRVGARRPRTAWAVRS